MANLDLEFSNQKNSALKQNHQASQQTAQFVCEYDNPFNSN